MDRDERGAVHLIALVIDANYHTAISKAVGTAEEIVAELEKSGFLVCPAPPRKDIAE